jgi:hypothetical protein
MSENAKFSATKDHLNKTLLEELNYKIWSTRGARFNASKRLLTKDNLSNRAIAFLTAYLIIFGLVSVYQISNAQIFNEKIIAFGSTTISILLLTFSQMEAAQDYKMRAHKYHDCALKISKLYIKLRSFKTLTDPTETEKKEFSDKLGDKYQKVLENYTNHESIDYKLFMVQNNDYFKLPWRKITTIQFQLYWESKFLYHSLIVLPPLLFLAALHWAK